MWPSQLKLQHLSQYRGMSGMIIANMYEEWVDNDCENSLDHKRLNVNEPNMQEHLEAVVRDTGIAFVIYGAGKNRPANEIFHVALLISREKHGVEYVDCMANTYNQSQLIFENKCADICRRYNKQFVGTKKLFSYSESEQKYAYFPPQTAEQQFVRQYQQHSEHFFKEIKDFDAAEQQRIIQFAKTYGYHDGGDCIFWAFHVANQLTKLDISAYNWFRIQSWFKEQNIMKAGAAILQYVTNKIFGSLLRCQKSKLKHITREKWVDK